MFHKSLHLCLSRNGSLRALRRVQECRKFSTAREAKEVSSFVAVKLNNKRLLRVSGCDSFIYLQSLLTNDMRQLLPVDRLRAEMDTNKYIFQQIYALNQPVIYSYICSAVGKVLCDLFIYRSRYRAEDGEYIIEVDASIATALKRLLLGYNISRNVKVELANDFALWTVIPEQNFSFKVDRPPEAGQPELIEIDSDDIKLVSDPRIRQNNFLGYRFLTRLGGERLEDIGRFIKIPNSKSNRVRLVEGKLLDYQRLRYRFGVSEGIQDNPSGAYFPFELNGDLLNAISLDKGLYTSEEKIIKIYSNMAIKQRIFPVVIQESEAKIRHFNPPPRTELTTMQNKKFGQLRQRVGRYGIANLWTPIENNFVKNPSMKFLPLLKHTDTGLRFKPIIPFWWPANLNEKQLPVPEYPRCLFNFQAHEEKPEPEFIGYEGVKEQFLSAA